MVLPRIPLVAEQEVMLDKESAEVRLPLSLRVTTSVRTPGEYLTNYNNQPLIVLILDVYLRRTLHGSR